MNKAFVLILSLMLAGTLAVAQDTLGSGTKAGAQEPNSRANTQSSTTQSTVIRGCLSGSAGNFTLTDQNGMQYKLMGNDDLLQSKVGHEIEITGTENQASNSSSDDGESMAHMPNSVQVTDARDVSGSCRLGREGNSQPLSNTQPDKRVDAARPRLMAMLQQPAAPSPDSSTQQSGNSAPPQSQSNPPTSSQTPATSPSSTGSSPSAGSSPAMNNNGTASGDSQSGQAAPSASGQENPAQTPTSPNGTSSQSNANDQNKPLYERQATDIPWARHTSNGGAGATNSPNPQ